MQGKKAGETKDQTRQKMFNIALYACVCNEDFLCLKEYAINYDCITVFFFPTEYEWNLCEWTQVGCK